MAHVNVRELIKRYEDLIADESTKTWVSKPFKMEDVQPVTMRSLSDVSVHYPDVVEPAPGEPHRGVDAVEISSDVPQDVVGTVGESDNETYKIEYLPVSQSIGKCEEEIALISVL